MRTIAIINQKGGCGKTTVAINLAAVLAAKGRRTLLVDMDPQSHCALGLAVPENQVDRSIADVLRSGGDGALAFSDVVWQISRNLDLAPSTMALAGTEAELSQAPDRDRRLGNALEELGDRYEFIIIDCPPSIGLLTFNALRAAGEVLIPVETGYFAMQGAMRQEATIQMLARRAGHEARFKVLANMYDVRTKLSREILAELRRHFEDRLLPVVVHFNSKLREAASFGQAITEYDGTSRGMNDFEKLADWLLMNPPASNAPSEGEAQPASTPTALSRAAELAQRARALARRTSSLSARLDKEVAEAEVGSEPGSEAAPRSGHEAASQQPPPAQSQEGQAGEPDLPASPSAPASQADGGGESAAVEPARLAPTLTPSNPLLREPDREDGQPERAARFSRIFGARQTPHGLLFVQPATGTHQQMCIVGDFNDWTPGATPLEFDESLGVWQALVPVHEPGRYHYRLVVDGDWINDPHNSEVEQTASGEWHSVVEMRAQPSKARAS